MTKTIPGTSSGESRIVEVDDIIGLPDRSESGLPKTFSAWVSSTDHKVIGVAYAVTALGFLAVGGTLAGMMRAELARPGLQFFGESTYNSLFTIHGSVMVFLFAVPFGFALANYLIPLMIGAPDMAFPRLNALSYWLYLFGGLIMLSGFVSSGGAAQFGWFAYTPLSGAGFSPNLGADLWIVAIILTGTSGTLSAVNIITTVSMLRAPGMTMFRLPILVWNLFVTSFMVLIAFPILTGALMMLTADRHFGAHFFDAASGGSPILWQHLFWFFGHPEVYIVALPFFGVATEIFPVFSRRPVFGYKGLVIATLAIAGLSTSVWAHHMFVTGQVDLAFFAATSMLIAVPTGVKVFNWLGTMWGGSLTFETPMLFAIGFIVIFVAGGVTGVILAAPTLDFHVSDTYFVVAHFHYVMGGTVIFTLFGAIYYWWPKVTGRFLSERLGKTHFWMTFVGFNVTFFVQHILGLSGMPRRVADYAPVEKFETLNMVSSAGYVILALATVPFLTAVVRSLRGPRTAGADPWHGNTLEWATTSPPPAHNFNWLPPIRSERPVFDLRWVNNPNLGASGETEAWRQRRQHDDHWFPLHPWVEDDGRSPSERDAGTPGVAPGGSAASDTTDTTEPAGDDPGERPT